MPEPTTHLDQAIDSFHSGNLARAMEECWKVLAMRPLDAGAIALLGVISMQAGQIDQAIVMLHHATLLDPGDYTAHHHLGEAWRLRGDFARAEVSFDAALRIQPDAIRSRHSLAIVWLELGRATEAAEVFRSIIETDPRHERACLNLGRALLILGKKVEAVVAFEAAIRIQPDYPQALNNLGAVLLGLDRAKDAVAPLKRALALQPGDATTHSNLGYASLALNHQAEARDHFLRALAIKPNYPRAAIGLASAYEALGQLSQACDAWKNATELDPNDAKSFERLGDLLMLKPDWTGAYAAFARSAALKPDSDSGFARLSYARQIACDWNDREQMLARLRAEADNRIKAGEPTGVDPFQALTLPWSASEQRACVESHSRAAEKSAAPFIESLSRLPRRERCGRLRIGYVSGDFHPHPIAYLIQGLFESHDREAFEIVGYSFGRADDSSHRRRIVAGCDRFRDVRELSHLEIATHIIDDGIDILVDLMGYTGSHRIGLYALRPAPIQVSLLGMVGTTGAAFIDYLISDDIVTPPGSEPDYSEHLVIMPETYMMTDNKLAVERTTATRADCGLPRNAVVLCCFNNTYKIDPPLFDDWASILLEVPEAVLWLYAPDPMSARNLLREAISRGIDQKRLIFTTIVPVEEYLARHALADLFLDTPLYNGHSTVALSLWAGLPVLTRPGSTFASRVATSLLKTAGLPELSVANRDEYRAKAIELCRNPGLRRDLAERLARNRASAPLFDTQRYTRYLEDAYRTMAEIHAKGSPPRAFRVPPRPRTTS